jgi:hypothetical protein
MIINHKSGTGTRAGVNEKWKLKPGEGVSNHTADRYLLANLSVVCMTSRTAVALVIATGTVSISVFTQFEIFQSLTILVGTIWGGNFGGFPGVATELLDPTVASALNFGIDIAEPVFSLGSVLQIPFWDLVMFVTVLTVATVISAYWGDGG